MQFDHGGAPRATVLGNRRPWDFVIVLRSSPTLPPRQRNPRGQGDPKLLFRICRVVVPPRSVDEKTGAILQQIWIAPGKSTGVPRRGSRAWSGSVATTAPLVWSSAFYAASYSIEIPPEGRYSQPIKGGVALRFATPLPITMQSSHEQRTTETIGGLCLSSELARTPDRPFPAFLNLMARQIHLCRVLGQQLRDRAAGMLEAQGIRKGEMWSACSWPNRR